MVLQPHILDGADVLAWRDQRLTELHRLQNDVTCAHSRTELSGELDWLLREVTGLDRLKFRLGLVGPAVSSDLTLEQLGILWQQRIGKGVPLQYLLGQTTWRNFVLKVSPEVLIPRPETEHLIDIVVETTRFPRRSGQWVDLGTGSGAIAIGLAELMPKAQIHAVDVSEAALAIARDNAQKLGFEDRIQFWQGSWFEPLPQGAGEIQGICSNPPYIPTHLISTLQPEVQLHEPHLALDGGQDGLRDIRHLVQQAQHYLCEQGMLMMECMAGQGEAIATLMCEQGYQDIQIHHDLAGLDRFVQGFKCHDNSGKT